MYLIGTQKWVTEVSGWLFPYILIQQGATPCPTCLCARLTLLVVVHNYSSTKKKKKKKKNPRHTDDVTVSVITKAEPLTP